MVNLSTTRTWIAIIIAFLIKHVFPKDVYSWTFIIITYILELRKDSNTFYNNYITIIASLLDIIWLKGQISMRIKQESSFVN